MKELGKLHKSWLKRFKECGSIGVTIKHPIRGGSANALLGLLRRGLIGVEKRFEGDLYILGITSKGREQGS